MSAKIQEPAMNKILAVAFAAIAFGLIGSLGWPLGVLGASGAALMAFLHYKYPKIESELTWHGVKRRPLPAIGYVLGLTLLGSSVLSLLLWP